MTKNIKLNLIVAATQENGIGIKGNLPWRIKGDMHFFLHLTTYFGRTALFQDNMTTQEPVNACIMGRKTWDSIPVKFRPLKNRVNIILSRSDHFSDVVFVKNLEQAIQWAQENSITTLWVIGGAEIYKQAAPIADTLFLTRVTKNDSVIECDTFVNIPLDDFHQLSETEARQLLGPNAPLGSQTDGPYQYEFLVYTRK